MKRIRRFCSNANSKSKLGRKKNSSALSQLIDHEDVDELRQVFINKHNNPNSLITTDDGKEIFPIHFAAAKPKSNILQTLLDYGADVHATTDIEQTALHVSATHITAPADNVRLLVDCGIDLNAPDVYGRTALHCACQSRNHKIVKTLLEYSGVDCLVKDLRGFTALDIAKEAGCIQSVELLEKAMTTKAPGLISQQALTTENADDNDAKIIQKLMAENQMLRQSLQSIENTLKLTSIASILNPNVSRVIDAEQRRLTSDSAMIDNYDLSGCSQDVYAAADDTTTSALDESTMTRENESAHSYIPGPEADYNAPMYDTVTSSFDTLDSSIVWTCSNPDGSGIRAACSSSMSDVMGVSTSGLDSAPRQAETVVGGVRAGKNGLCCKSMVWQSVADDGGGGEVERADLATSEDSLISDTLTQ